MVPFEGPVLQINDFFDEFKFKDLDFSRSYYRRFSFVEHIIELNDSLIQIMNSPVKISYLNVENEL